MKCILTMAAFWLSCLVSSAQYGDFGVAEQPEDSTSVDGLIDYGELLDFSGGYAVGDTVFNFTVYNFNGESVELYEELQGEKPVVLVNGSVSCHRFRNTFGLNEVGQEYTGAITFFQDYSDEFNWIFIYGIEAHPTDGNCPSNCPTTTSTDTTVTQALDYGYRRWAVQTWLASSDHDFPFTMYADNPNNAVYNQFFARPFGLLGINCNGVVEHRGDWLTSFFMDSGNREAMINWKDNYGVCSIDWEGGDDPDDDGDPVIYVDNHALNGASSESSVQTLEILGTELGVYPNPVRDVLHISGLMDVTSGKFFNLQGCLIESFRVNNPSTAIDVSDWPRGAYVLILERDGAASLQRHVVLQ